MSTPMHNEIERAYAEFEASKKAIVDLRDQLTERSTTVTSKNRELSVTVDSRAEITEVKFLTRSFRTKPSIELGKLLVDTIAKAREESLAHVAEMYRGVLPAGLPLAELMAGTLDVGQMMDDVIAAAPVEADPS